MLCGADLYVDPLPNGIRNQTYSFHLPAEDDAWRLPPREYGIIVFDYKTDGFFDRVQKKLLKGQFLWQGKVRHPSK